jgi:hypothetical protein
MFRPATRWETPISAGSVSHPRCGGTRRHFDQAVEWPAQLHQALPLPGIRPRSSSPYLRVAGSSGVSDALIFQPRVQLGQALTRGLGRNSRSRNCRPGSRPVPSPSQQPACKRSARSDDASTSAGNGACIERHLREPLRRSCAIRPRPAICLRGSPCLRTGDVVRRRGDAADRRHPPRGQAQNACAACCASTAAR